MKTLQERYAAALLARGEVEVLPSPTRKARTFRFTREGRTVYHYVGRSGSVRVGKNYTESFPVSSQFKEMLLAATGGAK